MTVATDPTPRTHAEIADQRDAYRREIIRLGALNRGNPLSTPEQGDRFRAHSTRIARLQVVIEALDWVLGDRLTWV